MAAVEKRKPPAIALLGNHMMFSVIALFIVLNMGSGAVKIGFGVFFLILYLFGVYDYSNRDGIEHKKSYSTITPSFKYPIVYGLIGMSYLLVPCLAFLAAMGYPNAKIFTGLFFLATNAQFLFMDSFSIEYINWLPLTIFCLLIMAFSVLGYLSGIKGFRLAALLSKYLYVKKKPAKKTK